MARENDDFTQADEEFKSSERVTALAVRDEETNALTSPTDVMKFRSALVKQYYDGHYTLRDKLSQEGKTTLDNLIMELLHELVNESDHLLGNELLSTHNGDIRDASVISTKRAEVIERAIKALQTKQTNDRASGLDVDAPAMQSVFRYFMEKVRSVFDVMGLDTEMSDTFFRNFKSIMKDWRKELKAELDNPTVD